MESAGSLQKTASSRRKRRERLASLLIAVSLPVAATPEFTESDLLEEIPVVNAVSRFEQRLDKAPASVTIIDRELIALSGAQDIPDLFRLVPGFLSYRVSGNRFGVSYHGIGKEFPNQLEVMVNGRSVYESLFSSVHWRTLGIDLEDIDHIEVIRGSNAAAQGSNAFLGSINIVTRKPVQDSGLALSATVGDWQTRNGNLRYNDSFGALDYRLALSYQENEGFPDLETETYKDGQELYHGSFSATYTPTLLDTIDFSAGYSHDRTGWGDPDHPDEFSPAQAYSQFQSLEWRRALNSDHEVQIHLYHNKLKIKNRVDLGSFYQLLGLADEEAAFLTSFDPTPTAVLSSVADMFGSDNAFAQSVIDALYEPIYGGFGKMLSERYDLQFQHDFRLSEDLRGVWGVGVRNESLDAFHPQSIDRDEEELISRFYTHGEWLASPSVTLNAGTMVEDTPQGVLFSPRFAINVSPIEGHTVRLAYARGNRAPSLLEANEHLDTHVNDVVVDSVRIADPDLQEERLDSVELGYLLQFRDPDIRLDARVFHERLSDVISTYRAPNPPEHSYFGDDTHKVTSNLGVWEIDGAEFQLNYRPWKDTLVRLHYTNMDLDTPPFQTLRPVITTTKGDHMPRHSGGILVAQRLDAWTLSLFTYHESAVNWEDGDSSDGLTRVDAQLMYQYDLHGVRGNIRFVAQNLGDTDYEFNEINRLGTRYFVVLEMELPD